MSDRFTTQNYRPVGTTSQRTDPGNRVAGAVHFRGKSVSIRTGGRVLRARGFSASFKRAMTKVSLPFRSASYKAERNLRHAEYQFDRHINRLVEDLANKPEKMSRNDIYRRLNRIHDEGKSIRRYAEQCGESVDETQLAARLHDNLEESLAAVNQVKPAAARQLVNNFAGGGLFGDLARHYNDMRQHVQTKDDARYAMRGLGHDRPGPLPPRKKMGEMFSALEQVLGGVSPDRERLTMTDDSYDGSYDEDELLFGIKPSGPVKSDDSKSVGVLRSDHVDAPGNPPAEPLDPSKPIDLPLHKMNDEFKGSLQEKVNESVTKDLQNEENFVGDIHKSLIADFGRNEYVLDDTSVSTPGGDKQAATNGFGALINGRQARVLSSLTHQGIFADFLAITTQDSGSSQLSGYVPIADPTDVPKADSTGKKSMQRYEVNQHGDGTLDFKITYRKKLTGLANFNTGAMIQSDPNKSSVEIELSGQLDPANGDQPVTLSGARMALEHEPVDG